MKEILSAGVEIAIGLGLILCGFAINVLGMASRRSVGLTVVSIVVLITIPAATFWFFAVTATSPFALSIDVNDEHSLRSWSISKTPIPLTLRYSRNEGEVAVFTDSENRDYEARLPPPPLPPGESSLTLTPRQPLRRSWSWGRGFGYYIAPKHGHWLAITGKSLGAVFASLFLLPLVWFYGRMGEVATIAPDED
ncbi:MAG: hypothetical protein ABI779_05480 [Acidobacteriota bacterium]